jgi:hypothetical protein
MRDLLTDLRALIREMGLLKLMLVPIVFIWLWAAILGAMAEYEYSRDKTTDFERYAGYWGTWSPDNPAAD